MISGAATEGVAPLFFPEKPDDLFCSSLSLSLFVFYCFSLGCHPLEGVTPHLFFYLSDLVSPLFFVNLHKKIFPFGCQPPGGCHPGGPPAPLPLVMPLLTYLQMQQSCPRHTGTGSPKGLVTPGPGVPG